VTCISCTLNFVHEVYFHTGWCFIVDMLKKDFLKLFPVVHVTVGKKQINSSIHYSSLNCMSSAILLCIALVKL